MARTEINSGDFGTQIDLYLDHLKKELVPKYIGDLATGLFEDARKDNRRIVGYQPDEEIETDSIVGRSPYLIKPGGYTQVTFDVESDFFEIVADVLVDISPRGRKPKPANLKFANSHVLVVNNVIQRRPYKLKSNWSEAYFINMRPYDRKIHFGLSSQAPNGVYQGKLLPRVRRLARQEFGGAVKVEFGWRHGPVDAYGEQQLLGDRNVRTRESRLKRKPALIVTPAE